MTSGRRAKQLRRDAHKRELQQPLVRPQRPGIHRFDGSDAAGVASQTCWCKAMSDLDVARKTVHDSLIAQLGPRREGPIYFRWDQGAGAVKLIDLHVIGEAASDEHRVYDDELRVKLRDEGGWIVVAFCAASPAT